MAYGEQPQAAPAAQEESSFMGMKWSDITKALQDKNVQRGIAQFGRQLSMGPVDPRTGKRTEGIGSGMAGTADSLLRGMNFQESAAKQAQERQLYNKAVLEYLRRRSGGQGGQGVNNEMLTLLGGLQRRPSTAGATSSAGWIDESRGPRIE
jgi:hypothetical protein